MAVNKFDITMMEDVGTSASQLLQRDGSGNIPAVDGSQVTGITEFTTSTSDPAIDTNPAGGVGSLWYNKTGGEMYVCTDATAGENVWKNVGAGSGNVVPYVYQGSSYGYAAGGYSYILPLAPYQEGNHTNIDKWSFSSDGNATKVGDLANIVSGRNTSGEADSGSANGASACSGTHGYHIGGWDSPGASDIMGKWAFATDSDGVDIGDMHDARSNSSGFSDGNTGYVAGGDSPPAITDMIQSLAFSSDAVADTTQNLSTVRCRAAACQTTTYGYHLGGAETLTATAVNTIERFQFATTNHAVDVGDLTIGARREAKSGTSSTTHGYVCGGTTAVAATKLNSIEKVQMVATANSTDVADILVSKPALCGQSSTTHGYYAGHITSSAGSDDIAKYSHTSDANATDVGNLTVRTGNAYGAQF
jgi:hypothetical protein